MENETSQVLTLNDLCDYCSSAAYVRVIVGPSYIDFCGHDYKINEQAIAKAGLTVIDERERLLERSSSIDVWAREGRANERNRR